MVLQGGRNHRVLLALRHGGIQVWRMPPDERPYKLHHVVVTGSREIGGGPVWCASPVENGRVITAGADMAITKWA